MGEATEGIAKYITAYIPLGPFIKLYMQRLGEASPWDVYKDYKALRGRRRASYQNVRNYFLWLRKLGLIEFSRYESSSRPGLAPKMYYRLTDKGASTPATAQEWMDPRAALYGPRKR